jgi:DNA polymerase III delta prime subunit
MSKITFEQPNYVLQDVKFNVDDLFGEHIKEPFPNQSFFWLLCGRPGSGKTSLMINALSMKGRNRVYRNIFDKILLVMPSNSRKSLKSNPLDDLPDDQMFENMSDDVIDKVKEIRESFDELDKKKKRSRRQLLILDDITAYLKDNPKGLIELATNRRHLKLSIILLVQFVRAVPRPVRFQITNITFFKPSNEIDIKIIQEEFINLKKDVFDDLKRVVFQSQHDFLMIDKNNEVYYKNLQKINFSHHILNDDKSQEG